MQWYYVKNGKKEGPLSNVDIPSFVRRGEITEDTLVWHDQLTDWTPYGQVDFEEAIPETPEPSFTAESHCSMCGKEFGSDELIEFEGRKVCGGCKPLFLQQIKENAEVSGKEIMRYAGFWVRFGAIFIDGLITGVITIPCNLFMQFGITRMEGNSAAMIPMVIVLYLIMFIVPGIYYIMMHGRGGATVGKKAVGIKVVMSDGADITYGRATGRYFAEMLSSIMNIGYIIAAFDSEKRALHDHICNTRVIYK